LAGHSVLPAQFHSRRDPVPVREAEVALMIAVLEDAIKTYLKNIDAHSERGRMEFAEVQFWFDAHNEPGLFAFENLCDVLGIDAGWLRRLLHRLAGQIQESRSATKAHRSNGLHSSGQAE
jgi:hypothetical protein